METQVINIECWRSLGRAIVVRTILDYQEASRSLKIAKRNNRSQKIKSCNATIAECIEFLRSDYCKVISNIDGNKILEVIDDIQLPTDPVELDALIRETPLQRTKLGFIVRQ